MTSQQKIIAYSHERFNKLAADLFDSMQELWQLKGAEYSGDEDRLKNFRRNAEALGVSKETIWAVYAAKHWDALMQYVRDEEIGAARKRLEAPEERVKDLIVYLLLFAAMLDEKNNG